MLTSMTGFGRAEAPLPAAGRAVVEVRTLNHRFLEVETRLPERFQSPEPGRTAPADNSLEETVRAMAARLFRRGRVRVSVSLHTSEAAGLVAFETGLARRYAAQLRALKRELRLPGEVTLEMVLGLPQVVAFSRSQTDWDRIWPQVRRCVEQALNHADRMRKREGARLTKQLARFVATLEQLSRKAHKQIPAAQRQMKKRLADRIQELLRSAGGPALARSAALTEAATFVQSSDVREEMDRIASHLAALRQAIEPKGGASAKADLADSPGRTIDFLAQELHREVNTLGAKMRDVSIVRSVIAMKGQIEKLREQAANVE